MSFQEQSDTGARMRLHRRYVFPENLTFACLGTQESHQYIDGGFSGTVFSQQPEDASFGDIKTEAVIDLASPSVAL